MAAWKRLENITSISSPWVTVHCERWEDSEGQILDYWRAERPDSIIVLPILDGNIILPKPTFRPGIGEETLDFPGGRLGSSESIDHAAHRILQKELRIHIEDIDKIVLLSEAPWHVDSSFSSQKLRAVVAYLKKTTQLSSGEMVFGVFQANASGIKNLFGLIHCLQCRSVLLHWYVSHVF